MKPRIGLFKQGAFLFVGQKSHSVVVLCPALDICCGVLCNLLVVDPYAEDERECCLPTVPTGRFPVPHLCLFGQPADRFLYIHFLARRLIG